MEKSRFLYRPCCPCFLFYRKSFLIFFLGRIKISVRITRQGKKKRRSVLTSGGHEKVVGLGKNSGKIRNRTESRSGFSVFSFRSFKKYCSDMDRFFCVSTGFFVGSRFFICFLHVASVSSFLFSFTCICLFSLFTYACICARTHARAKYIM